MNRIERSLATLRRKQAERVMPRVGMLLDAWENTSNDEKGTLRAEYPHLCALIENINEAVEADDNDA